MSRTRDYQKSKVYAWEREHIDSLDVRPIPYDQAQSIVNYIWESEGLEYPPKIEPLPKQTTRAAATGSRTQIRIPETTTTGILIHELAHSLTCDFNGYNERHGSKFMAAYMHLLAAYLKVPMPLMMYTATKAKIDFELYMGPTFV